MPQEDKISRTPPPDGPDNPWEQADVPEPGVLGTEEAHGLIYQAIETLKIAGRNQNDRGEILNIISRQLGCGPEALKLGGPVDIAKGSERTLVLGGNQDSVAGCLYKVPMGSFVSRNKLYATVSGPSGKAPVEVVVKTRPHLKGASADHLVISERLAKDLDIDLQSSSQIVIESMYQKVQDLNLDEI